MAYMCSPNQSL